MYCGSCLEDNTLASALTQLGIDIQLIPLYTPIRTDDVDVSEPQVFFGGLQVYLEQRLPLFRWLPNAWDRWLSHPRLLRWISRYHLPIEASQLGELTLSMLRGAAGNQRKEVDRLCRWLEESAQPDLVHFTNMLIAGCAPELRRRLGIPMLVTLQGDDLFLDQLPDNYRGRAISEIRKLADEIDGFLVHSRYYADYMAEYLSIDRNRFHQIPLGIKLPDSRAASGPSRHMPSGQPPASGPHPDQQRQIGYLARIAPEKGLHLLCQAFMLLKQAPETSDVGLRIAGWLGEQHRAYLEDNLKMLRDAGYGDDVQYLGELDRAQKEAFLSTIDILSVPTTYAEPKGLYVLEALSAGVPVVQPAHGAFPELLDSLAGGELFRPQDPQELAIVLTRLLKDHDRRAELGQHGQFRVREHHSAEKMAHRVADIYRVVIATARRDRP